MIPRAKNRTARNNAGYPGPAGVYGKVGNRFYSIMPSNKEQETKRAVILCKNIMALLQYYLISWFV